MVTGTTRVWERCCERSGIEMGSATRQQCCRRMTGNWIRTAHPLRLRTHYKHIAHLRTRTLMRLALLYCVTTYRQSWSTWEVITSLETGTCMSLQRLTRT